MKEELPWVKLKDVHDLYNLTLESARNAIQAGRFPVSTYKLGNDIVIDREVHEEFFRQKREAGLACLRDNRLARLRQNREK